MAAVHGSVTVRVLTGFQFHKIVYYSNQENLCKTRRFDIIKND
jgi:hypothetical protein